MLEQRDPLLATSRPQKMTNVDTPEGLAYMPPQDVPGGGLAPKVVSRSLPPVPIQQATDADAAAPPLVGAKRDMPPLVTSYIAKNTPQRTSLAPLIDARVQKIVERAKLEAGIRDLEPMVTPYINQHAGLASVTNMFQPAPEETPEESASGIAWYTSRAWQGLKNVPGVVGGTAMDFVSIPWYVGAMLEQDANGPWQKRAQEMRAGVAAIKAVGAPERDPNQSAFGKITDPGIIVPALADFGSQIAIMFTGGGLLGAGAKGLAKAGGLALSVKQANILATAAGAVIGGNIEGKETYFKGIELGMTPGEAAAAYAKHASISGVLSTAQLSFLFNKMPAPLQQKLLRKMMAGGTDAITESLDETAGAWSLDPDLGWKEALRVTGDALTEIGPAAFIVGMFTGHVGLPPEVALKAASANAVQSQINYAGEGKSVMDQVGEERLKGILEGEATYFRTVDGVRHSTMDGKVRGGIVEGDSGYYWIPGRYGNKDGELLPIRLSDIVEVGTVGENAEDIVTHGSEQFQRLKAEADVTTSEIFGPIPQMRTKTFEDAYAAEREIAIRRIIAESAQKRAANQEAEFEKFTTELDASMQQREAVADNVRGVENAVRSGMPEIGPDAPVAGDIPADIDAKMFAQLDKIAEDYVAKAVVEAERDIQAKLRYIDTVSKRISDSMVEDSSGNTYGLSAATFGPVASGAPQALNVQDVETGADTLAQAKAAAPLPNTTAETVDMSSGDWTRVLLTYSGSENMMEMLKTGETTVEEVMMQAFQNAGKLKFVPDSGKKRLIATKGIAGQSDERYNASMMSFVRAVREAKTALHYVMENEYAEDYGLRDDRLENVGAMPPRAGAVGQQTLFSSENNTGVTRLRELEMATEKAEASGTLRANINKNKMAFRTLANELKSDKRIAAEELNALVADFEKVTSSANVDKQLSYMIDEHLARLEGLRDNPDGSGTESVAAADKARGEKYYGRLQSEVTGPSQADVNNALTDLFFASNQISGDKRQLADKHRQKALEASRTLSSDKALQAIAEAANAVRRLGGGAVGQSTLFSTEKPPTGGSISETEYGQILAKVGLDPLSMKRRMANKAEELTRTKENWEAAVAKLETGTTADKKAAEVIRDKVEKGLASTGPTQGNWTYTLKWGLWKIAEHYENSPRPRALGSAQGPVLKSTAPGGKTTRRRTVKSGKSAEAIHGFAATMKRSNLYHSLVKAGSLLGWDDHYAAAEIASEIVYAQANAQVAAGVVKTVSEYYDKYLGDLVAEATEVTKLEYEMRQATQGYAIPREMLFSRGFRVAAKKNDGTIVVGEPGEVHAMLSWRDKSITEKNMGFVDAAGTFMTRAEALQRIAQDEPSIIPRSRRDMELDSVELEDYDTEDMLYSLENRRSDYVEKVMNTPGKIVDLVYKLDMYSRYLKEKRSALMTEAWKHTKKSERMSFAEALKAEFDTAKKQKELDLINKIEELDIEIDDVYAQKLSLLYKSRFVANLGDKTSSVYGPETLRSAFNLTKAEAGAVDALFKASGLSPSHMSVGSIKQHYKNGGLLYGHAAHRDWRIDADFITLGKSYIGGTALADVNTAVHELAHVFRKRIFLSSATRDQEVFVKPATLKAIKEWAGADSSSVDEAWGKEAEEKFANGFVKYVHLNMAETADLKAIFDVMGKWMTDAYAIDRIYSRGQENVDVSPEVAALFDKMLDRRTGTLFSEGAVYMGHEQLVLGAFDPASKDIELFLGSDLHTVLHEFAHAWRRSLSPKQLSAAGKWAHGKGWKAGDAWTVKGEERFAEGFVAWAGDSNAKVPKELEDVFEASAKYLSSIYSTGRALRPDVKTSAALSSVMEKIITKQLLRSANADDREEGRRRKRTREEFSQSKTKDLGDHIDMMAEFLNVPPQSARDKAELVEEMYARKRNPKYREELDQKLLEWEETGNPAIDLVDFLIVRDRAIEIRVKFENDFRDAYRKGPEAVNKLVDKMAKDRTHMDVRFYRMVAGDAGRRLQLLTNKATQIDTAVLLANTEKAYGAKSFDVLFSMMQDPKNAWNLADKMAGEMAPTMWDLYMQAYYGFRLSSPDVLAVNFFGTGLWTMWNYSVHRPFAGAIDLGFKAMSNITSWGKVLDRFYFRGNPRTRDHFNTSVLPLYAQLTRSVPYGTKLAKEIILDKTGGVHTLASVKNMDITTRDVNSWQRFTMRREGVTAKLLRKIFGASKGDMAIQKWEDTIRTLGPITAAATTFMRASDMMFKVIAVEGEMNRIAQEEAAEMFPRNPTAQAGWIKTRTASIVNDPGQLTPAQAERLSRVAEYNTFTDMPMKASRYVLGFRESLPIVKLVFPYFNTLVNLGKRGLEMVPGVGLGMEAMYRTDPEFQRNSYGHTKADIIAKQLEGAMFIAGVFLLLDDDELTGAAPEDPQERKHFYEAGKLEYAMKLGDTWYSYANIQPFNIALGMTANVRKYALANLDKLGSDSVEVQEKVTRDLMQAAWSVGSFMLNNDFMRSFEQYATAKTAERRAKVLGSTIESALIPYNGFLRWAMRTEKMMQNEEGYFVQQERDTLAETAFPVSHNLLNAIFGLPSTESNKLTVWGEPYHYADNKWYDTWLPVQYSKGSQDSVDKVLEELQYMPELPSRTYDIDKRGYQYDREIWQQLALGYGAESKPKLARLVESPGFQRKHKEDKVVAIQALLKDVRDKHVKRAKAAQRRAGLKPTGEER